MSGGSYEYICYRLEEECKGRMYDAEMNDMIKDLVEVLHDLEWWQSGDSSEKEYRVTLSKFKQKWFHGDREERLKRYIDEQTSIVRRQLYEMIGEPTGSESGEDIMETLANRDAIGYEECFTTGNYDDQECEFCPHRGECSGWEEE